MTLQELKNKLEQQTGRSAWQRGVIGYAWELFDNIEMSIDDHKQVLPSNIEKLMLNGAQNWHDYSWGGCSDIYDCDIAKNLCTATELKRIDSGRLQPNKREQWLDVQARALFQAAQLIKSIIRGF